MLFENAFGKHFQITRTKSMKLIVDLAFPIRTSSEFR